MIRWLVVLLLVGCATAPTPVVCHCEVPKPRPKIDVDKLLEPCPIPMPKNGTLSEKIRVANARLEALEQCNKDKAVLRERLRD